MNIAEAKQIIKDTVELYLARDEIDMPLVPTESQRPLFLVGPPGIGKTAIVSQVASEIGCGLVSYSMTHHTRQSALGLPYIVEEDYGGKRYRASEYTMSEIIASVYDCMRDTGHKKGILFLDEINCVSETLYPSMLQFLQFKTFGRHRVPDDWIVVCAGNPPAYNKSVHEFDIVTLDRLRKINIEPDFEAWRSFALASGCHPAIIAFLDAERECFYQVLSTPEGKSFVTARAWIDLSRVIHASEAMDKAVDRSLMEQFLQDEDIANKFAVYYELFNKYRAVYDIDGILAGSWSSRLLEQAHAARFDEKMALLELLLDSLSDSALRLMVQYEALMVVRDELRSVKESSADREQGVGLSTLISNIYQGKRASQVKEASIGVGDRNTRIQNVVVSILFDCSQAASLQEGKGNDAAFSAARDVFDTYAAEYRSAVETLDHELEQAFSFVDNAYGSDREMLIFVTDLMARPTLPEFIALNGCDAFYRYNEALLSHEQQSRLSDCIDKALDEEGIEFL